MKENDEDIKVNRRSTDKAYFESPLIQSISDTIDILRDETKNILNDLDSTELKQNIDDFDIEEFGRNTIDHFSDIVYDLSQARSKIINSDDLPDFVKESSKNAKMALNRDEVYVRRAERVLNKIDSNDDLIDKHKSYLKVIELSDKAIDVNRKNSRAYYLKGFSLVNMDKYDDGIEELIKSLALDENNLDARLAIATANLLNNDFNDAMSIYDSVLAIDENSFKALLGKAVAYFYWEKPGQANIYFKKANAIEELDGDYLEMWNKCSN